MRTVFTNGCFDILHRGHFELLRFAKSQGDILVVGLNSDTSVRTLKGNSRPFFNQEDRKFALESCRFVDSVITFNELDPHNLIKEINPDIIVKGGDYKKEEVVGFDLADVIIFNFVDGYSTSKVLGEK